MSVVHNSQSTIEQSKEKSSSSLSSKSELEVKPGPDNKSFEVSFRGAKITINNDPKSPYSHSHDGSYGAEVLSNMVGKASHGLLVHYYSGGSKEELKQQFKAFKEVYSDDAKQYFNKCKEERMQALKNASGDHATHSKNYKDYMNDIKDYDDIGTWFRVEESIIFKNNPQEAAKYESIELDGKRYYNYSAIEHLLEDSHDLENSDDNESESEFQLRF